MCASRAYAKEIFGVVSDGAPVEREREANYLNLPNNSTTFLQENRDFLAPAICRYEGRIAWRACMSLSISTYVLFKIRGQRYGFFLDWAKKYHDFEGLTQKHKKKQAFFIDL